jgi:2-hydroxyglutarate dehydrogenase
MNPTVSPTAAKAYDCDAVVVGAGIVGLATARALLRAQPGLRVVVLEREGRVAAHQSGHNSGVIHAGVYYAPGSLKARLAVRGARALYAYCEQREIAHRRCGKLIVAASARELPALEELERRARANGVAGVRRLAAGAIADVEPAARGVAALHVPETGVVDFAAVAQALAQDVRTAGGEVVCGREVRGLEPRGTGVQVVHAASGRAATSASKPDGAQPARSALTGGEQTAGAEPGRSTPAGGEPAVLRTRLAVVCAGAWSDALAPPDGVRIVPFRGAYRTLRPERAELVRALIYPVPDPRLPFLGVHLTRGLDDSVHVGPTALPAGARDAYRLTRVAPRDLAALVRWPGTWRMARHWWRTGATELRRSASRRALAAAAARLVPAIEPGDLRSGPDAGVRAQAVARDGTLLDDFLVAETPTGVYVRNAPSPGATAALALGELVAQRALERLGPGRRRTSPLTGDPHLP